MAGTDLEDECGLGCSTFAAALPLLLCWQSPPLWVRSDWEGSCSACLAPRPTARSKAIMEVPAVPLPDAAWLERLRWKLK